MSVVHSSERNNPTSAVLQEESRSPEQVLQEIEQLSQRLRECAINGATQGESFDKVERGVWELVLQSGACAMDLFVKLQGTGDLGEQVVTDDEQTLKRGSSPTRSVIRSIFGEHVFEQYTYSPGQKKKVSLYSVSARMQLPENRWSYLLQEFSQIFCVDQAFNQSAVNLGTVLGNTFSVDTLEQTSQRMGVQAGEFLDQLPVPAKEDEGQFLVASADCKGVPLLKEDAAQVAAFETAKKHPGNRRMATVTSVYTVDPHVRTAEQITDALFRDKSAAKSKTRSRRKRPQPRHKHTTAHFPKIFQDDDQTVRISGIHEGMAWLAGQVAARRQMQQMLILLMDGQASLWDVADLHLHDDQRLVEILDIIHVASYVWDASLLFHQSMKVRKAFTRKRLLKILKGETSGVIRGLRRMGSLRKLKGKKLKDLRRICGYFEKHQDRMRYDEYLAAGYPIASGVIEGACRHLVKDRMERSGMRWTLESARSMLNVRAAFQSDYWDTFCKQRIAQLVDIVHPHRNQVGDYTPLTIAC